MGLLSNNMDPIEKAKHYIEQLKDLSDKLAQVSKTLETMKVENSTDADEYERLYEKEFEISMILFSLHEDIYKILDYSRTPSNDFIVKRLKKEADKVFTPVFVEIK